MSLEGPQNSNELFKGDSWVLPTDLSVLEPAEEALTDRLRKAGWNDDEVYNLEYAFHEALINAIAHGNLGIVKPEGSNLGDLVNTELKNNPEKKNKKICVVLEIGEKRVKIKIQDEGNGFKIEEVKNPTQSEGLLKTKGRGLFIMEKFFDSVTYNGKGNEVTLVKEKKE